MQVFKTYKVDFPVICTGRNNLQGDRFMVGIKQYAVLPKHIPFYLLRPVRLLRDYDRVNLRADVIAGITVAVILLPQAIAFALIAELPPEMGLYTAIVGAIIGALWGCSNQIHTGPTNAISLLVLSTLLVSTTPGTPEFILAAGLLAVMVGIFQLVMGLARLGLLVNFVSHSVIVGFATGAGVLIAIKQLLPLFKLKFPNHNLVETIEGIFVHLPEAHFTTVVLGVATIVLIVAIRKINAELPATLISMVVASLVVYVLGLDQQGVAVIGQLPRGLPPLTDIPIFDLRLIAELSTGALAVGAIGLVETAAISKSISTQTGQRLDSNQEFVGQGLANICSGFFSGYPCAGSFSRSAVNFKSGAKTPLSALFSSAFVVIALFTLAPAAAYLPRAALAGVLIVTAYGMIDQEEIKRVWRGTWRDASIMVVTFLGTLFLHIEFAVLMGILLSFAGYILKTSSPQVYEVLPDDEFKHFTPQPNKRSCSQLGIIEVLGDMYFGAAHHVEEVLLDHMGKYPEQRYLLLRLHSVNQCDFSGVHALEVIVHSYRERGGDVFIVGVRDSVMKVLKATESYDYIGAQNFLVQDAAIKHLYHHILDPAICVYECPIRVFKECQNLPKPDYTVQIHLHTEQPNGHIDSITPEELWHSLHNDGPHPYILDIREPREFNKAHIPEAHLLPLPRLLTDTPELPHDRPIVTVGRSDRRSKRAAQLLLDHGYADIQVLKGGMVAWETENRLVAVKS
ncbi:SulP family inorganic anion transporter [Anaerolineales bacterium HSG6]|nr:SulP family inorganic anion transporter [Anaerolineales bacterium HSG6]